MFVEVNGMQENKAGEGDSEVEALNREVREASVRKWHLSKGRK